MDPDVPQESDIRLIAEGRFLRFVERDGWEFVERSSSWAVVLIIPITDAGEIVFVEQYRPPVGRRVIELPAGLVGDLADSPDETLETAARRELEEETGYVAGSLELLFTGVPSGGLTSEAITFFLARDLHQVGPGGGDATDNALVIYIDTKMVKFLTGNAHDNHLDRMFSFIAVGPGNDEVGENVDL